MTKKYAAIALVGIVALQLGIAAAEEGEASQLDLDMPDADGTATPGMGEVGEIVESSRAVLDYLVGMLANAKAEGDVMRVTCLQEKLNASTELLGQLEERAQAYRGQPDAEGAALDFAVVTVMGQRMQQSVQEAAQCLGQDEEGGGMTVADEEPLIFTQPTDVLEPIDLDTELFENPEPPSGYIPPPLKVLTEPPHPSSPTF